MAVRPEDIRQLAVELAAQLQAMIERLDQQAADMPTAHPPEEAAKVIGVTVETLCRWRLAGKGPRFIREGRFIRYPADGLREFMLGSKPGDEK